MGLSLRLIPMAIPSFEDLGMPPGVERWVKVPRGLVLATGPTVALGLTKWLLHESANVTLGSQLANEAFAMELSSRTDDFREGLRAFREKRAPHFSQRSRASTRST